MLFSAGVYVERHDGSLRFRWVTAPTSAELARLTETLALRIGRSLERQGLSERDPENSYLAGDELETGPMAQLLGASITYRIAEEDDSSISRDLQLRILRGSSDEPDAEQFDDGGETLPMNFSGQSADLIE